MYSRFCKKVHKLKHINMQGRQSLLGAKPRLDDQWKCMMEGDIIQESCKEQTASYVMCQVGATHT